MALIWQQKYSIRIAIIWDYWVESPGLQKLTGKSSRTRSSLKLFGQNNVDSDAGEYFKSNTVMKINVFFLLIPALILVGVSCNKGEEDSNFDCNSFKVAVINMDSASLNYELSKLLKDSDPLPTADDPIGQFKNIENLMHRISECGQVYTELKCYACIETNPPQSEILIRVDSAGVFITQVIDISTPKYSKLKFLNIHKTFVL